MNAFSRAMYHFPRSPHHRGQPRHPKLERNALALCLGAKSACSGMDPREPWGWRERHVSWRPVGIKVQWKEFGGEESGRQEIRD